MGNPVGGQWVMIIRHGEKPVPGKYSGINLNGEPDPHSLIPQGWMRCGALGQFFLNPKQGSAIAKPTELFASVAVAAGPECPCVMEMPQLTPPLSPPPSKQPVIKTGFGSSLREQELLLCVSGLLGLPIKANYPVGMGESLLAQEIVGLSPTAVVLIAWEHDHIPKLARAINSALGAGVENQIPREWDGKRFDLVWVFQPVKPGVPGSGYGFIPVPQSLLPGDNPIASSSEA